MLQWMAAFNSLSVAAKALQMVWYQALYTSFVKDCTVYVSGMGMPIPLNF